LQSFGEFVLRYISVVLLLFGLVGLLVWHIGTVMSVAPLSSLGLAIFSSCSIGILFKWLSLDLFLNMQLRHLLLERDYVHKQSEEELKKGLECYLREFHNSLGLPETMSISMENMILSKVQQPYAERMRVILQLERRKGDSGDYLWVKEDTSYVTTGGLGQPVFPNYKIIDDNEMDIPKGFVWKRPEDLYRFVSIRADGKEFRTRCTFGPQTAEDVVRYSVEIEEKLVFCGKSLEIEYSEEYVMSLVDTYWLVLTNFADGIEVDCFNPDSMRIEGCQFTTSGLFEENRGSTHYRMKIKGLIWPGNGLSLLIKPVR